MNRPRTALTPDHLAEVASVYAKSLENHPKTVVVHYKGKPRPVEAVAEHFGVPYTTARRWVSKAHRVGALANLLYPSRRRSVTP